MTMTKSIHWFRQDLRTSDNPAWTAAAAHDAVLPLYIWDTIHGGDARYGRASRCWLAKSLEQLNITLQGSLAYSSGDPLTILIQICAQYKISTVTWTRCYEPWQLERDRRIKEVLQAQGIRVQSENGSLLWEPWTSLKADGSAYRVFTPFYRKGCLQAAAPREPLPAPQYTLLSGYEQWWSTADKLWIPCETWSQKIMASWEVGEEAARHRLDTFITQGLDHYKEGRNYPARPNVSRLSAYLRWGEISPNQIWYAVQAQGADRNIDHFCSELGWREFSYSQLYHNPDLMWRNLQSKFDRFVWRDDSHGLRAWQRGQTGIPLVDAGMRELWARQRW